MDHRREYALVMLLVGCLGCESGESTATSDHRVPEVTELSEPVPAPEAPGVSFPTSCGAATQARFEQGIFLLHNMMYKQAHAEFAAAAGADAKCAMLHWGIAMTQFHPQWPGEPTEEALETGADAVRTARSITARTTERERGYIEAVGSYYQDWRNNDRYARKANWREAQERHAAAHPEDSEAQIFFLLAQLTTSDPFDKTYAQQLGAAEGLEEILEQRPEHPGLLHYLLHAYDNPVYARRGVGVAQRYESVAPDAPHALHMPSHIYVRLGDWGDVISGNIRSQASALRQPAPGGRVSKHFLHALDYLVYGFLQLADDERALQEVSKANADTEWQLDSGPGAYALSAAPARFAIERRAWKEAATLELRAVPYSWDRYPWAEALTHAARGLGAARSGDIEAARASIDELDRFEGLTSDSWWQRRIRLERDVISGWIAHEQGKASAAVQLIGNAAEEELSAGKLSVEPGHTLYAVEQLGELLLELDRPREALEAFRRSLADSPKRFHSLFGAGRAAELAKMDEEATGYYAALTEMVVAGNDRPQVQHASDFLAKEKQ